MATTEAQPEGWRIAPIDHRAERHNLLPDPEQRSVWKPLVSADDHLLEPLDLFVGRVPSALSGEVPQAIERNGLPYWLIDGELHAITAGNAISGRPIEEWDQLECMRYDEVRPGVWDVHHRVRDMDLAGISASLNFPSMVFGFAGQRLSALRNPAAARAAVAAWNDWLFEEWISPYPDRFIACGLVYLGDPEVAAREVRRNAERGFRSVSFSENPERLGLPSVHTPHWEPFFEACAETGTVINLHVGSSSQTVIPSTDSPMSVIVLLFEVNGMMAASDWLFSRVGVRHPDVRIAMSEGGIGWVPMILDRLDYKHEHQRGQLTVDDWDLTGPTPAEVLRRNFRFTTFYDPSAFEQLERIGVDNVMVEVDYPHADSSWPDSQEVLRRQLAGLDDETADKVMFANACELYRHRRPVPESARVVAQS